MSATDHRCQCCGELTDTVFCPGCTNPKELMSYDEHLISMAGGDGEYEKELQRIGAKYAHMYVLRKADNTPLKEFKLIEDVPASGDGDVLDQIQSRADKATPGPWIEFHENGTPGQFEAFNCPPATGALLINYADWDQKMKDATFIAHARTDVPALLALVREQQARIERVEALSGELSGDGERAEHYTDHGFTQAKGVREAVYGSEIADRIRAAISAVSELHKPEEWASLYCSRESVCEDCYPEFDDEGAGHKMLVCTECVGVTDDDNPGKVPYPCPTVSTLRAAITATEGA